MAKIERTCKECVFYAKKECVGKIQPCHKWIYKKANCRVCTFLDDCHSLGKGVSSEKVCLNFKKNSNPPKNIDKYETEIIDEEPEFSPVDLVENIISQDYDSRIFQLIDDRDIPKATNPVKFIISKKFLGINVFPMQLKIFLEFFSGYCPFCSDTKFIKNIAVDTKIENILDRTVPYTNGICPKCKRTKYEAFDSGKSERYDNLIGVAGQRSGKSISVGILAATVLHQFLTLKGNPVEFFGLLPNSTLHGTFVGLRYNDAFDNLWEPFYNLLKSSKWYQNYHSFLQSEGQRIGVELVKVRDTFIAYKWKNIGIYPSGPDRRTLRGRTRIIACLPSYILINTNKGFIRADDYKNLIEATTFNGKDKRTIIDHIYQGKKEVFRATLENGIELDATYDHRVLTLTKSGRTKWVEQEDLEGKYVFCQLKGSFPKELLFNHNIKLEEPKYVKVAKYINNIKTFTIKDLMVEFDLQIKGVHSHYLSPMLKAGVIDRKHNRNHLGHSLPTDYKINANFKIEDWTILKKGVINNKKQELTIPDRMTPELARLIGYLIADGDLSFNEEKGSAYCISFSTTNKNKVKDFKQLFFKLFNCRVNVRKDTRKYGENGKSICHYLEFSYNTLKEFFTYLGLSDVNAHTKTLPWCILQAPRECAVECLSAMVSCDGAIRFSSYIYYSSKSHKLLKSVQLLFMKLGYPCKLVNEWVKLYNFSSYKFLNDEYTGLDKRDHKKDLTIELSEDEQSYIDYKIPFTNGYILNYLNNKHNKCVREDFKKFINQRIIFSKVIEVKSLGKKKVYDISVDSEDSIFPANNVLVHNSLDELGWFMGSDGSMKLDPDGVYEALDNSLMTVQTASRKLFKKFPDIPTAVGMYISSPSSKTDKSMRLYKQSLTSSRLFGFHASTWEFNPNITKEDLQQKYNEDPIAAERDFGANPPFGISPYIKGPSSLVNVFSSNKNVFINKGYKVLEGSLNESLLYPKISFAQKHTYPSILSIDCSYNNNSFACVLSHLELDENNDKKFVVSGIIEIVPVPYPISFVSVYEKVICRIIENYNVILVIFDRWQSIDLSQRIFKDYGINSFWYSVKYVEFELFKAEVYGETAQFPKLESDLEELIELDTEMSSLTTLKPCNHFFLQLLMCKDTGRMVTKGDDVTDDILRAVILGYAVINKDEYIELFTGIGNKVNDSYSDIRNIVKVGYKSVSNAPVSNVPSFNSQQRTTFVPGIGSFRRRYGVY